MRVCIIFAGSDKEGRKLKELATALARGINAQDQSASVEIFNMYTEQGKNISFYDYYVIGSEAINFFGGKIPHAIKDFLRQCGNISGKRCFCFVNKKGLRCQKTLSVLMKTIENEGAFITNFEIIKSSSLAQAYGKRLKLNRG